MTVILKCNYAVGIEITIPGVKIIETNHNWLIFYFDMKREKNVKYLKNDYEIASVED